MPTITLLATLPRRPPGGVNSFVYSNTGWSVLVAGQLVTNAGAGVGGAPPLPFRVFGRSTCSSVQWTVNVMPRMCSTWSIVAPVASGCSETSLIER